MEYRQVSCSLTGSAPARRPTQAGRALEYESSLKATAIGAPDPDAFLEARDIGDLRDELALTEDARNRWSPGASNTYQEVVPLSQALGFQEVEIPGIG